MSGYLPNGYQKLSDLKESLGEARLGSALAAGEIKAFTVDHNGRLSAIPPERWRSNAAAEIMRGGSVPEKSPGGARYLDAGEMVLVRVPQPSPQRDGHANTPVQPIYKSGVPGRPTSIKLVEAEMRRRANDGRIITNSLEAEAEYLARWLKKTHPQAPRLKGKSIENNLRGVYRMLPPKK